MQIAPDWRQAQTLKKTIEDRIKKGSNSYISSLLFICPLSQVSGTTDGLTFSSPKKNVDGVIGIGIAATVVGVVAGGIAAALARKN